MKNKTKYYGFYRGKVVQLLSHGFCRIEIPAILERVDGDPNTLPLAEPAQTIGGGGNTLNGTFTYPAKNSIVWCFFEGGNLERPVYFATSNVKSQSWDQIVVNVNGKNTDNTGDIVYPTSNMTKFNRSTIEQKLIVDPKTGVKNADSIELTVETIPEIDDLSAENADLIIEKKSPPIPIAATLTMDNKDNSIKLTAKNSIVLEAPNIELRSHCDGKRGSIFLNGDTIENVSNFYRIMSSKINILGFAHIIMSYYRLFQNQIEIGNDNTENNALEDGTKETTDSKLASTDGNSKSTMDNNK